MIKTSRNKNNPNINTEKENNFISVDNPKVNNNKRIITNYNEMPIFKSDKKIRELKIKFIDKNDKDILSDKNAQKKIRIINDEDIIDKPLLDKNSLKIDKNKGYLENKIIELEYFTKKKI